MQDARYCTMSMSDYDASALLYTKETCFLYLAKPFIHSPSIHAILMASNRSSGLKCSASTINLTGGEVLEVSKEMRE